MCVRYHSTQSVPREFHDLLVFARAVLRDPVHGPEVRAALAARYQRLLIDEPGIARSVRECPEIDGVILVDDQIPVGSMVDCLIVGSQGTDLEARLA